MRMFLYNSVAAIPRPHLELEETMRPSVFLGFASKGRRAQPRSDRARFICSTLILILTSSSPLNLAPLPRARVRRLSLRKSVDPASLRPTLAHTMMKLSCQG